MKHGMKSLNDLKKMNFDSIPEDPLWNVDENIESKIHRIHAYPAKFPAFITTKALKLIDPKNRPKKIADIFCGCGTVAYEAKRNNIDFWGCDINPVATMIAKVKSQKYDSVRLTKYLKEILENYLTMKIESNSYDSTNERLKYWYTKNQYESLNKLKTTIEKTVPRKSLYRAFFICAFSNILKPSSRWLTKSIKPQVDPVKEFADVISIFKKQCNFMITANNESDLKSDSTTEIVNANILRVSKRLPVVDLIITSPPYVTSYEYADLHQLSSLWLGFASDYRELRKGSIGSRYLEFSYEKEMRRLNSTGLKIVNGLLEKDKEKARSVTKYFLDMQAVAKCCRLMLAPQGKALFVIGDTEFKGVRIENARHLSEALLENGFKEVKLTKRKITRKILTPYRDCEGKFTTDKKSRKVYAEEFILIGSN